MNKIAGILGCALVAALAAAAAPPVRVVILTGQSDYPYHEWQSTTPFLERVLQNTGRFDVRVIEEPQGITRGDLADYDAVLLNYNGPRWSAAAETAVEEFVRAGKGMVSFHGVTYGPFMGTVHGRGGRWIRVDGWSAYSSLIGATWAPENIGHAVRHTFSVKLTDREHPITRGVEPEFTVNDELYHRIDLLPGTDVLATAFDDASRGGTGRDEPIAWAASYGKGRIFHCALGHDIKALNQADLMALFARAVEWAGTGTVTVPSRVDVRPNRQGR